jgi:hypothetical protein
MRARGQKAYTVNHDFRARVLPTRVLGLSCTLLIATMPSISVGSGTLSPYVAEEVEHNTNIFDVPNNSVLPAGYGNSLGDTFFQTRAGVDGVYLLDQQRFFGTAEFRRLEYDRFTSLDHNEYLFDGGLKYKLTQAMDGTLEYRHEQRMVQFQDLVAATTLILETENTANASLNVNITPEWRVESHFKDHLLDSPRSDVPQLSLHEDSVHEGLRYVGVSNLSAGIDAEYLSGIYRHDPLALSPKYHQTSIYGAATYAVSGLTNFSGDLGYTSRSDPTNSGTTGNTSGITGDFTYRHNLSGKTTMDLGLRRGLSTYLTTGGNEIDSTASAGLTYQVTFKIGLTARYEYTISKFADQDQAGGGVFQRTDHFQIANVQATYQALHWLLIRPYARYQKRTSNTIFNTFNGNAVGIEFIARPPNPIG